MNNLYVILNYVGSGGEAWTPRNKPYINAQTMEPQYSNRDFLSEDKEVLLIEKVACEGGKIWAYYEYLRYGIIDAADRENSFYGITLVTDSVCTDIPLLLCLFRTSFNKYIIGTGLQPKGDTFKVVATADADALYKKVEDFFVKILSAYQDFGLLSEVPCTSAPQPYKPLSLNNEKQVLTRINPEDITPATVQSVLSSGKKIAVSDRYPALALRHLVEEKEKLNATLHTTQNRLDEAQSSLSNAKKQNVADKTEIASLRQKVDALSKDADDRTRKLQVELDCQKKEYEDKLKKYAGTGNYSTQQQLDKIVAMLMAYSKPEYESKFAKNNRVRKQSAQITDIETGQKNKSGFENNKVHRLPWSLIACIAVVLVCIGVLLLSLHKCGADKDNDKDEEKTEQNSWKQTERTVGNDKRQRYQIREEFIHGDTDHSTEQVNQSSPQNDNSNEKEQRLN